jgi:hypothetical protein
VTKQSYGAPSYLLFGDHVITSEVGLQQGDPFAPLFFCAAVRKLVESLKSALNVWFLDDGTTGGKGETVLADLQQILNASKENGLVPNPAKCELLVLGEDDPCSQAAIAALLPGLRVLDKNNAHLLGAPLNDESLESCLVPKVAEIKLLVSRLPKLQPHTAFFLLRHCLAIPKLTYFLRCAPTWRAPEILLSFDTCIREGLQVILNIIISDSTWALASLPAIRGGLGIRCASDLSIPAFLASVSCTAALVSAIVPSLTREDATREEALALWRNLGNNSPEPVSNAQAEWEAPILNCKSESLLSSATSPEESARILASTRKESGAWLSTLPSPHLGTMLDGQTLRIAAGLRLGTPLCHPHTCRCGKAVDDRGTHGLSCIKSAGRFSRHSAINDILKRACISADIPATLEPTGLTRSDGRRPDGLTLIPWARGRCLTWDSTVADTLAACYLPSTSRTAGSAAQARETVKRRHYEDIANSFIFCPFAVETLGPFGDEALRFVKDLGRRLRVVTGEPRSTNFLIQRISVAIQRGNAACILGTIPASTTSFHEVFNL